MFKAGSAEQVLEVPLFVELMGYGFFAARRNRGVIGDLYCRAFSFNDGETRAMIVYSDLCFVADSFVRELRVKISQKYSILPECISFVTTHTHSGPSLSDFSGMDGFGIANTDFQEYWKRSVMEVVDKAFYDEEEISYAEAGKAPLTEKLGENRVEVEKNITDETIRWVKFIRPDGSCKILLHSHGIHGITMNGPMIKYASSDWAGSANRMIQEQKLADMPLFLLGPCGDINAKYTARKLTDVNPADYTGERYVADLRKNIEAGGEKLTDLTIRASMKTVRMPVVKQSIEELAADAEIFRAINDYEAERANRIDEMIIRIKRGDDLTKTQDLQVLRIGELSFLFVPGEYFIEDGNAIMNGSEAKYSFAVTLANGCGGYYPSEKNMKKYPRPGGEFQGFGYYEVYGYPQTHSYKFQDNIAGFVRDTLLEVEKQAK